MRFKINEIGAEGLPLHVPVTPEWMATACPDVDLRPGPAGLALDGRFDKTGEDYLLRAHLRGELESVCARCLEPARVRIDVPVAVTFVSADADDEDDDPDVVAFQGGEIDLGEEIRNELLLAVPINPLCRESCRGLCEVCGENRNLSACTCKSAPAATAPFATLAKLKLSNS
jgi:uncharacterized metal-binding protein YceD (DUF177 family)